MLPEPPKGPMACRRRDGKVSMRRTVILILAAVVASLAPGPVLAAMRPYLVAGAATTRAEKEELDDFLDPYTVSESTPSWEAGGGLRFFPRLDDEGQPFRSGVAPWALRLHFGLGGGDLDGVTVSGRRFVDGDSFEFTSVEAYSYSSWTLGAAFQVNLHPRAGVFLGPSLQSVTIDGERTWTGPEGCAECGDAKESSTIRYGLLELGGRVRPGAWPLYLEASWIPARVELSTTQIRESDNWSTVNFASFKRSFGLRLAYDF